MCMQAAAHDPCALTDSSEKSTGNSRCDGWTGALRREVAANALVSEGLPQPITRPANRNADSVSPAVIFVGTVFSRPNEAFARQSCALMSVDLFVDCGLIVSLPASISRRSNRR